MCTRDFFSLVPFLFGCVCEVKGRPVGRSGTIFASMKCLVGRCFSYAPFPCSLSFELLSLNSTLPSLTHSITQSSNTVYAALPITRPSCNLEILFSDDSIPALLDEQGDEDDEDVRLMFGNGRGGV